MHRWGKSEIRTNLGYGCAWLAGKIAVMLTEGSMLNMKISMQKLKGGQKSSDLAKLRKLQRRQDQGKNRGTRQKNNLERKQGD